MDRDTTAAARGRDAVSPAAFYCVADARYFLGAVALVNSLRLQGQTEPVFVLDLGLEPGQRELLGAEATIVDGDPGQPPWLAKTVAPRLHPTSVMTLIDVDMIVARPLADLLERAERGRIVAFLNDRPRFRAEWGELLDLGVARRLPYVSSGIVVLGGEVGLRVLELLDDRQGRVEISRTLFGEAEADYPFLYPEQDVLNAILCTVIDDGAVARLPNQLGPNPPFAGLELIDVGSLRVAYADGTRPYVLHHFHRKPWIEPIYHGLYSRLLARLLLGDDVAVRVPPEMVPLRLRGGPLARAERARVDLIDVVNRYVLRR
jgi:hypothetical protein